MRCFLITNPPLVNTSIYKLLFITKTTAKIFWLTAFSYSELSYFVVTQSDCISDETGCCHIAAYHLPV
jgi:hypothetical protein